jgi:hypothetical protein
VFDRKELLKRQAQQAAKEKALVEKHMQDVMDYTTKQNFAQFNKMQKAKEARLAKQMPSIPYTVPEKPNALVSGVNWLSSLARKKAPTSPISDVTSMDTQVPVTR